MRTLRTFLLTCLMLAMSVGVASAQGVSEYMPYQGFLADATGTPVDGTYNLTFKLYETSDAQTALWEESIAGVQVTNGAFAVSLGGVSPNMKSYMTDGRAQYLSVAVNGESVSPRQRIGSQAYAYLAYNATKLGGYDPAHYATLEQLNELTLQAGAGLTETQVEALITLAVADFRTETQIVNLINTAVANFLTETQINTLITTAVANFLTETQINNLITTAVANFLTETQINNLITTAIADFLTETEISTLINTAVANFLTETEITNLINNAVADFVTETEVNTIIDNRGYLTETQINNLISNLQTQITNLQNQVNNLNVTGVEPEVLGVSNNSSNGRFSFGDFNGIRAANAMCEQTFTGVSTAHLCSVDEVTRAVALGNVNATADNVETWTIASSVTEGFNSTESLHQNCAGFLYNSGDFARGTTLKVDLNYTSAGNGGGVTGDVVSVKKNVGCGNTFKVLCCR